MEGAHILLHNLSHSDLVLSVGDIIARPKFSHFRKISEQILKKAGLKNENNELRIRSHISYFSAYNRETEQEDNDCQMPVGFDLAGDLSVAVNVDKLRLREDHSAVSESGVIDSAHFPLIAILLPKWLKSIEDQKNYKKVLVLVSGRGTPSDSHASVLDNSTKYLGRLILEFIKIVYPEIEIRLLHSNTNLFRYDENIMFVKRELLPLVDAYRDELFNSVGSIWKERMNVCLSFADGSSARINAINASLKYYRYTINFLLFSFHFTSSLFISLL